MTPSAPRPADAPDPRAGWTWYHVILTTYGAWLPGDPRGFRTRHHRRHVEGDYKNPPPPGEFEGLHRRSRDAMKRAPVAVPPTLRAVLGNALRDRLEGLGALVVCVAITAHHIHLLAKMPTGRARPWIGIVKRHGWFVMRDRGWTGKLWGKRGKEIVVRDRQHQLNAYGYIVKHESIGAWVWKWTAGRSAPE